MYKRLKVGKLHFLLSTIEIFMKQHDASALQLLWSGRKRQMVTPPRPLGVDAYILELAGQVSIAAQGQEAEMF